MRIRLARNDPRDAKGFCALSNSLYTRRVNEAYYIWQFFACPFPSLLFLAVDDTDTPVGSYGIHLQGHVAWVLDMMVSPTLQRQGVFRQLAAFGSLTLTQHDLGAIVVLANEVGDRACINALGWRRINTIFTYTATPDDLPDPGRGALEFERVNHCFSCDPIITMARTKTPTANTRSVEYLNWRFIDNTRYPYEVFVAHKHAQPFGYLVLKLFHDPVTGLTCGDLVDILWVEDDKEALAAMLRFSLARFRVLNAASAAMWLQTNTVLDEVGLGVGFHRSEQRRLFSGKALKDRFNYIEEPRNWFLNMCDSEVY